VEARASGKQWLTERGYDIESLWEQPIVWGDHDAMGHVNVRGRSASGFSCANLM
jgi:hypothetical protein